MNVSTSTSFSKYAPVAFFVGIVGLVLAGYGAYGGLMAGDARPVFSWLIGFSIWFSAAIGMLLMVMIFHIFCAGWPIIIRRQLEHAISAFPYLAVILLPLVLIGWLYHDNPGILWTWMNPESVLPNGHKVADDALYISKHGPGCTSLYGELLSSIINAHYEVILYRCRLPGKWQGGYPRVLVIPVYYATPTVAIRRPPAVSEVLNADNRNQGDNAYNISMKESVDYFTQFSEAGQSALQSDDELDENLQKLLADIEVFEDVQAARLYDAYAVLTPMLKAYKAGVTKKHSFEKSWSEAHFSRCKVSEKTSCAECCRSRGTQTLPTAKLIST